MMPAPVGNHPVTGHANILLLPAGEKLSVMVPSQQELLEICRAYGFEQSLHI